MNEIIEKIRTSLQSRRINFNVYEFNSDSIVIISNVRGRKMTINLAHLIKRVEDNKYIVSDYDKEYEVESVSSVASRVITLIRKAEMAFSKYTKK